MTVETQGVDLILSLVPKMNKHEVSSYCKGNDRDIGKQFASLWRELADQLKLLFPDGDDEGAFIVPALDARSHVLSIEDRRNGVGKPVFKLASLGSGQPFAQVSPDLSVPGVSPEVLQRVLSHANKANV